MHSQLETYLRGGQMDYSTEEARMISEIARSGAQHLPPPETPGMVLEKHFSFEAASSPGIVYQGFIDVQLADGAAVPGLEGGAPVVIDHKSTSNFRYAKTPEDLRTDPQAVIYAYQTMEEFRSPVVDLKWIYYRTRGSNASHPVHLRVVSSEVVEEFRKIQVTSKEMFAIYSAKPDVLSLPPSTDACNAYRGCPYKMHCTDLDSGPFGHISEEEQNTMTLDLFAKLEASNASETPAAALPVALPMAALPFTLPLTTGSSVVPLSVGLPLSSAMPLALMNNTVPINPPEAMLPTPPPVPEETKSAKPKASKAKKDTVPAPAPISTGDTLYIDCAPVDARGVILVGQGIVVDSRIAKEEGVDTFIGQAANIVRGFR